MNQIKEGIQSLEKMSEPLVEFLRKNYDPYCSIIITDRSVTMVRSELFIPIKEEANP